MSTARRFESSGFEVPKQYEVLVLDDNEFDRKRIHRALTRLPVSLNVTEVADLEGFFGNVAYKRFDLILIDFSLSDGDGLQALEQVKLSHVNRKATLVMVTGNDSSALAVNALKSGFDDYVTKDELNSDTLAELMSANGLAKTGNITPFPLYGERVPSFREDDIPKSFSPASLEEVLEPALRKALDNAVNRAQMDEISGSLLKLVSSLHEEDDFIFYDPH